VISCHRAAPDGDMIFNHEVTGRVPPCAPLALRFIGTYGESYKYLLIFQLATVYWSLQEYNLELYRVYFSGDSDDIDIRN
jgi:hypothetical protein